MVSARRAYTNTIEATVAVEHGVMQVTPSLSPLTLFWEVELLHIHPVDALHQNSIWSPFFPPNNALLLFITKACTTQYHIVMETGRFGSYNEWNHSDWNVTDVVQDHTGFMKGKLELAILATHSMLDTASLNTIQPSPGFVYGQQRKTV